MASLLETKVVDPEAELSNAVRIFQSLALQCSVEKRAGGISQLAPQEKQLGILSNEMKEILLCINLAKKGLHLTRDRRIKRGTKNCIIRYEELENILIDANAQKVELDCLNYLARKQINELWKLVPTEVDELRIIANAHHSLRRMEHQLEMVTKRFCIVNVENAKIRHEIERLLIDRNNFSVQWNRTIGKLVKGKEYLMDLFEMATNTFGDRDEWCRKLEALKWKGLFQLNRDISEMHIHAVELNHLSELKEFLRFKGSIRICEADEFEEMRKKVEIQKCEKEIARYDALLEEIFEFAGTEKIALIISQFKRVEKENFSFFQLLCEMLQEYILQTKQLNVCRQKILDERDIFQGHVEMQEKEIVGLKQELDLARAENSDLSAKILDADAKIASVLKGIEELVGLKRCDITPLLALLGNQKELNCWNVDRFLKILEMEVKTLIQVIYSSAKRPPRTPKGKKIAKRISKLVADPVVVPLKPNRLEKLVPYHPCAYCVQDFIMNLVTEGPAVPADKKYIQHILHLEEANTKFGIFTLTLPA